MENRTMEEFVEHVRAGSDIVSVVSSYVSLKKKGNRYWGCCPFHQEKTPSFSVVPRDGFFYCFGCHVGGDVFKFLSMVEGIKYFEAIKLQATKLNIPLPEREKSEKEILREKEANDLEKVQDLAKKFFHSCLMNTPYGKPALDYLHGRGITDEIITEFSLGFAPDSYEKLYRAFLKREVSEELLILSGLVIKKDDGGVYDRFRSRVMIPITDEFGHVVGFGGRVLGDAMPKYLNSPETVIFNKRKLLFGLDKAKQVIKREGYAILVEGYMDAISLSAAGIKNVVASLGTAFTIEQCRKLLRYAPYIYFCYDSDEAGQQATMRALSIVKETGAKVKILSIPDGKDPDEFIRKHGVEGFRELTKKALPLVEYQMKYVLSHNDYSTLEGKSTVLTKLLPVLNEVSSVVELSEYIVRLSRTLGIDEGILRSEINRFSRKSQNNKVPFVVGRSAAVQLDNAVRRAGRIILRNVWLDGENGGRLAELSGYLPFDDFPYPLHGEILRQMEDCLFEGLPLKSILGGRLGEEALAELSYAMNEALGEGEDVAYKDSVLRLRREYLQKKLNDNHVQLTALEREGKDYSKELEEGLRIRKEMDELQIE